MHQPSLDGWCMGAGPEGTAEVRQPLLTVEVLLAGAGPSALQQIGSDLAQCCGNQARQGVGPAAFTAGDGNEHCWIWHRQGCSQATDQSRQPTMVRTVFQSQHQAAESTGVIQEAMPWQRCRSSKPTGMELKPVMAWRSDRVCLSVRAEGGSTETAGKAAVGPASAVGGATCKQCCWKDSPQASCLGMARSIATRVR